MTANLLMACLMTFAASDLDADESIVFYPTIGSRTADGSAWEFEIHGWIYELEWRSDAIGPVTEWLDIDLGDEDSAARKLLSRRARPFLVDNERRQRVEIKIGDATHTLDPSQPNGHFTGRIAVPNDGIARLRSSGQLAGDCLGFSAVTGPGDSRSIRGQVRLLMPDGLSVISDIDDTIKITEVRDKKAALRNTLLRPFKSVPGMAKLYHSWAANNSAAFHYVSASPWQLYEPLAEFTEAGGFPQGSWHMKSFRWKDRTAFSLFGDPVEYKIAAIEPILRRFPKRRFILVGDSGEKDPEAYGELARRFPESIQAILIRDVSNEERDSPRYSTAFNGLAATRWRIFRDATELQVNP